MGRNHANPCCIKGEGKLVPICAASKGQKRKCHPVLLTLHALRMLNSDTGHTEEGQSSSIFPGLQGWGARCKSPLLTVFRNQCMYFMVSNEHILESTKALSFARLKKLTPRIVLSERDLTSELPLARKRASHLGSGWVRDEKLTKALWSTGKRISRLRFCGASQFDLTCTFPVTANNVRIFYVGQAPECEMTWTLFVPACRMELGLVHERCWIVWLLRVWYNLEFFRIFEIRLSALMRPNYLLFLISCLKSETWKVKIKTEHLNRKRRLLYAVYDRMGIANRYWWLTADFFYKSMHKANRYW